MNKKELYENTKREYQEDDTLMGRLAKRMQSRDYIDNVGLAPRAPTAKETSDVNQGPTAPNVNLADVPTKMSMGGVAKRK